MPVGDLLLLSLLTGWFRCVVVLESNTKGKTKSAAEGIIGVVPSGEDVVEDGVVAVVLALLLLTVDAVDDDNEEVE